MQLLLLHGATGIWDEVACLAIPATAIMGIALAVLRERAPDDDPNAEDGTDDPALLTPEEAPVPPARNEG